MASQEYERIVHSQTQSLVLIEPEPIQAASQKIIHKPVSSAAQWRGQRQWQHKGRRGARDGGWGTPRRAAAGGVPSAGRSHVPITTQ